MRFERLRVFKKAGKESQPVPKIVEKSLLDKPEEKKEFPAFTGNIPDEFNFHQERFERMAKKYEASLARKINNWNVKMSAKDFAHEEAIRDNADFEKREGEEFEAWEKDLKVVTDRITEKVKGIVTGEVRNDIRPLLVIMGGGMKGASGAGQALIGLPMALQLIADKARGPGVSDISPINPDQVFDVIGGISAGAPTAAFAIGGGEEMAKGASIFPEECTQGECINTGLKRLPNIMNIGVVTDAMTKGEKVLNQQNVLRSGSEFFVVVTREEDEACLIVDAKTAQPGMMNAIAASMAVPLVYGKSIEVNGAQCRDGAFCPLPLKQIIEKYKPTDILVLPQVPFDQMNAFELNIGEFVFAWLSHKAGSLGSMGALEKIVRTKQFLRTTFEQIQKESSVNIGVLFPPDSDIGPLTTDPDQVEMSELESARGVISAFGLEQPGKLNLFHSKNA